MWSPLIRQKRKQYSSPGERQRLNAASEWGDRIFRFNKHATRVVRHLVGLSAHATKSTTMCERRKLERRRQKTGGASRPLTAKLPQRASKPPPYLERSCGEKETANRTPKGQCRPTEAGVSQEGRAATGHFKTTNQGALMFESGLRPANTHSTTESGGSHCG